MANGDNAEILISIVVPVYNVCEYLEECVKSLVEQSYKRIEIILVDDGSTDSSGNLCDTIAVSDSRIKVIHKKNGGLSDARNAGINIAKGEYIGFVDSDDWIDSQMYEKLLEVCIQENAQIGVCGFVKEFVNNSFLCPSEEGVYSAKEALLKMIENKSFQDHACTKLFKTSLFKDISFPYQELYEDARTIYKVFLEASIIVSVPDTMYHYRQRRGSIAKSAFNENRLQLLAAVKEMASDSRIRADKDLNAVMQKRILLTECIILREILNCNSAEVQEKYKTLASSYLKHMASHKMTVLKSKCFSKSMKVIALFSFLGYEGLIRILRMRIISGYYQEKYVYFQ